MAKRILIADDSVTIQKAFAMTFAGADDMTVAGARSADEALSMAQRLQPDLILADGQMPGRTGYDLCASVRGDPSLRAIPVYILASIQQPYDEGRGQQVGVTGHLLKPWDTAALLDRLREAVARGTSAAPSVPVPAPPPARTSAASMPAVAIEEDEYGEISIDSGRDAPAPEPRPRLLTPPPPAPVSMPPGRMTNAAVPAAPSAPAPAMRPSLIPGMRPGTMPPMRPGTAPVRPLASQGPAVAPPRPAAAPSVGRTLMGLPAANVGGMRPSPPAAPSIAHAPPGMSPPMRAPTAPVAPLQSRGGTGTAPHVPTAYAPVPHAPAAPPAPVVPVAPPAPSPAAAAVSASVDQKLAAFAAKGPEYEAIAKLSREIIEQVVWEVVPELAEVIIREHIAKRGV
jgi:CheY-like chemotaxis protein